MNYLEIAKQKASEKKIEDSKRAEAGKTKHEDIKSKLQTAQVLLKKELEVFDGQAGFTLLDSGDVKFYGDCCNLMYCGANLLRFSCRWDTWEVAWSDDCKSDLHGVVIRVFYCQEDGRSGREMEYRNQDPVEAVKSCMNSVASYLSKFL